MSLLLDALKKAAEEKKRNSASSDTGNSVAADNSIVPEEPDFGFDLKDDDTLITELDPQQRSETSDGDTLFPGFDEDESTLFAPNEDETQIIDEDETQSIIFVDTDDAQIPSFDEDESILIASDEEVLLSDEDVSDFLGRRDLPASTKVDDTTKITFGAQPTDEDLSLNLVDPDYNSDDATDSQTTRTNVEILGSSTAKTDPLEVVDYSHSTGEDTTTLNQYPGATVTSGIELDNLRNENTIIRRDTTSTNTYAPDNYDRTLIKSASEDASKIFAGMKTEEDVLITPDYAKRVFLSKSSAHRAQHYKISIGIAASILLAIGILAMVELQDEYDRVDTELLPLKRDPMPGVIKIAGINDSTSSFDESGKQQVDNKTLELIENAELTVYDSIEIETDTVEIEVDVSSQTVESNLISSEVVVEDEPESKTRAVVVATVSNTKQVKQNNVNQDNQISAGTIKILTSSKVTDQDRWLADAYAAYQRGDDETALKKYNQVLQVDPLNRNALLARAAIAIQNGDVASAIADYRLLLLQNPKDSLAMSSLISVTSISPQQSETQLKLMIREEPDSPYLNFVLANIYGAQNRWQEAQSLYFKALENNPEDPNYAYNLAISLEHISKPGVAISYYEKALVNIKKGLATFDENVVSLRLEMLRKL